MTAAAPILPPPEALAVLAARCEHVASARLLITNASAENGVGVWLQLGEWTPSDGVTVDDNPATVGGDGGA